MGEMRKTEQVIRDEFYSANSSIDAGWRNAPLIDDDDDDDEADFDTVYEALIVRLDEWHNSRTEAERARAIAEFEAAYTGNWGDA